MSRIAMNDIFVAVFIVAAYLALLADLVGPMGAQRLVGAAAGRRPHRPRGSHQVGRLLRPGRHLDPRTGAFEPRAAAAGRLVALGAVVGGIGAPWPFLVTMLLALARCPGDRPAARPIRLDARRRCWRCRPPAVVLGGVGLAFALAYDSGRGRRHADGAVEIVFALLARGAQVGWPAWTHARRRRACSCCGAPCARSASRARTRAGPSRARWAASPGRGSARA